MALLPKTVERSLIATADSPVPDLHESRHCPSRSAPRSPAGPSSLSDTGRRYALDPGTRQQAEKVHICMVQVSDGTYSVEQVTIRGSELVRFGIE